MTTTTHDLIRAWLPLWNGATHLARDLVSDDFTIWLAGAETWDTLTGPDEFAAAIDVFRADRPDLVFAGHDAPLVDGERGALTWTATRSVDGAQRVLGGLDVFSVRDGRIHRVWSITGARAFTF
ncbi:hypothetical protein BH11ACT8_BH11ACT8_35190 [soil metagenome]